MRVLKTLEYTLLFCQYACLAIAMCVCSDWRHALLSASIIFGETVLMLCSCEWLELRNGRRRPLRRHLSAPHGHGWVWPSIKN